MRRGFEGEDLVWSRGFMYMYWPSFSLLLLFCFDGFDSLTSNPRMYFLDSYM